MNRNRISHVMDYRVGRDALSKTTRGKLAITAGLISAYLNFNPSYFNPSTTQRSESTR